MHRTASLSILFPTSLLLPEIKILRPRLSCEVKIIDSEHYYETKIRFCADGSRMIEGFDYESSYAPVDYGKAILLMIALAASKRITFYFLGIMHSNLT